MRHALTRLGTAAVLTTIAVAALAGCGSDDADGADDPDPTTATTDGGTSAVDDVCHVISDAEISDWSGFDVTVNDQDEDSTGVDCGTVTDADDPKRVSWKIVESAGSLARDAELNGQPGLKPRSVQLPSGADAKVLSGEVLGQRIAVVVAPTTGAAGDGNVVVAEVLNPDGFEEIALDQLIEIASNVASAYTT